MSIFAARMSPVMIKPASGEPPFGKALFLAFLEGREIVVHDNRVNEYLTGPIVGIRLESGFTPPETPHHFLVSVRVGRCADRALIGQVREVYVRTED